ncbi:MAG: O-antigen ligase family protein [Phenylobacterium sp.]|uniref:O-antigen ligase family protein n=1 Tax=Phenylobacterium sp. TaxID=1871053 RepID=UPI001A387549|nr:O-antigen ligase family protein [Phenylobacterium sp.]MBL8554522.1 O-antigen ligase family protein [Phenylobacterium sp.]
MIRALTAPFRRLGRPSADTDKGAIDDGPLLAGYKRAPRRSLVLLLLAALALACFAYGFMFGVSAPARMMPFTVPIVVLAGLTIWALPPGDYAPTKLIEPLFIAFFAAMVLWPNYLAIALPSLPWLTLLRIIGVPLVLVMLICVSVSKRFRTEMKDIVSTDKLLWQLLALLVLIQALTIALSSDPGQSLNRFIIAQVNQTAIFFAACYVFTRERLLEQWVRMLLIMLVILSLFGLWEWRLQLLPWAGHIPSYLKVEDEAVQRILSPRARASTGIYRVHSTATTPLGLAEILGMSMPFAMHFLFDRYPLWMRVAAAAYIPFTVNVILLTDSRLGVVASLASVIFYLLIWALLRWRQNRDSVFGPAISLAYPAIFTGFVAATFFIGRLRAQVWGDGSQRASTESRIDQWIMGIPKIIRNPLGYGLGRGADELGFANGAGVITIDSYFLSVLLELGVLGFIVYFGLLARGAFVGARTVISSRLDQELRLLVPLSVTIINFIIVKSVFSQDANHPLIFMMLGAIVAASYRARKAEQASASQVASDAPTPR